MPVQLGHLIVGEKSGDSRNEIVVVPILMRFRQDAGTACHPTFNQANVRSFDKQMFLEGKVCSATSDQQSRSV